MRFLRSFPSVPASLRSLLLGALLAGASLAAASADRHVILISLDGFPANLWREADVAVPNLRRLAAEGASADAMTVSNPSITWVNHTTLVTGVTPRLHGVLFNGLLVHPGPGKPPVIEQWADRAKLVRVPTLYDRAKEAGLTTAESNWVAVTRAPTIDWGFAEFPKLEDPVVREMIAAGRLTAAEVTGMEYGQKTSIAWHDQLWSRAAKFILEQHRPNLLMFHALTLDSVNHTYGVGTLPSRVAMEYVDSLVGELMRTVERLGLKERTTFLIVSDHGHKRVTYRSYPNVVLKHAGYLEVAGANVVRFDAYAKCQGGVAFVYIADPAKKAALLPKLTALFAADPAVGEVVQGTDAPKWGMPSPAENDGMGDLILYPKDGYAFTDLAVGEETTALSQGYAGTHGYRAEDPEIDGIFIASGAGIKPGVILPRVRNLDVAPTAARLLGLDLPGAEGKAIEEILVTPAVAH
jgi:predicted AlkP superfamily pyrophosphatase or phosphodiesterase